MSLYSQDCWNTRISTAPKPHCSQTKQVHPRTEKGLWTGYFKELEFFLLETELFSLSYFFTSESPLK